MLTSLLLKMSLVGAEWVLWLLLVLSFISISLIVERCIYFYRHRIDAEQLGEDLQDRLRASDFRGAWELVKDSNCIECEVVSAGLQAMSRGSQAGAEAMLAVKAMLRPYVDARLSILATIGSNSPFIGLLGTVLGVIKAAHDLTGGGGQGDPNAVMAGVFEALVATAVGLFVAIPAVIAFNLFQRQVRRTMSQVDSLAHLILATVRLDSRSSVASVGEPLSPPAATARVK